MPNQLNMIWLLAWLKSCHSNGMFRQNTLIFCFNSKTSSVSPTFYKWIKINFQQIIKIIKKCCQVRRLQSHLKCVQNSQRTKRGHALHKCTVSLRKGWGCEWLDRIAWQKIKRCFGNSLLIMLYIQFAWNGAESSRRFRDKTTPGNILITTCYFTFSSLPIVCFKLLLSSHKMNIFAIMR